MGTIPDNRVGAARMLFCVCVWYTDAVDTLKFRNSKIICIISWIRMSELKDKKQPPCGPAAIIRYFHTCRLCSKTTRMYWPRKGWACAKICSYVSRNVVQFGVVSQRSRWYVMLSRQVPLKVTVGMSTHVGESYRRKTSSDHLLWICPIWL